MDVQLGLEEVVEGRVFSGFQAFFVFFFVFTPKKQALLLNVLYDSVLTSKNTIDRYNHSFYE
jgi:hypothetical protein